MDLDWKVIWLGMRSRKERVSIYVTRQLLIIIQYIVACVSQPGSRLILVCQTGHCGHYESIFWTKNVVNNDLLMSASRERRTSNTSLLRFGPRSESRGRRLVTFLNTA